MVDVSGKEDTRREAAAEGTILMSRECFDMVAAGSAEKGVCTVRTVGKTGVEMEALTGVSCALLTVYDMCKAVDRTMEIGTIRLITKSGGKSGNFINPNAAPEEAED